MSVLSCALPLALSLCVFIPIAGTTQPQAGAVSASAFRSLSWLHGKWIGSGGGFAAFYEEYRVLNDSTIEQFEHPDSTFSSTQPRSTISWRNGSANKGLAARVEARLTRIAGDTVRFESLRPGGGGFTWIRQSSNTWTAILDGRSGPVVYTLRRVTR